MKKQSKGNPFNAVAAVGPVETTGGFTPTSSYQILTHPTRAKMAKEVLELMAEGWKPLGGVAIVGIGLPGGGGAQYHYVQAMGRGL